MAVLNPLALSTRRMQEVDVPDIDPDTFRSLLVFAYTGSVPPGVLADSDDAADSKMLSLAVSSVPRNFVNTRYLEHHLSIDTRELEQMTFPYAWEEIWINQNFIL